MISLDPRCTVRFKFFDLQTRLATIVGSNTSQIVPVGMITYRSCRAYRQKNLFVLIFIVKINVPNIAPSSLLNNTQRIEELLSIVC